jgi:hypothetical protein
VQTEPSVGNNQLYKNREGVLAARLTQDAHSCTSQKTTFFIVTAVKISNLTYIYKMILKGSDDNTGNGLALGFCPPSGVLKKTTFRKLVLLLSSQEGM